MQYTKLGNSDLNVSRICMGCMGFGDAANGQHTWTLDDEHSREIIKRGLELGVNFFDTAIGYQSGTSEQYVGRAVRDFAKREDVVVATKFLPRTEDEIAAGITGQQHIERMLNTSLSNLGLDYVDLYLIHWPAEGWQEAWAAMQELYAQGRMRAIGVSNFERNHLTELLEQTDVLPAVDQVESSPTFPNQDLIDFCHGKDIAVEAWSPLGGTGGNLLTDQRLLDIGEKYGKSSAQVVLRWDLQRGVIPLPKSVHSTRIMQNIHVFDFELDESEMQLISSLDTGKRNGADPNNFDF